MSYDVYWVKNRAEKIADFEHPTLQGALLIAIIPRALPWAKSFCPFMACCSLELLSFHILRQAIF